MINVGDLVRQSDGDYFISTNNLYAESVVINLNPVVLVTTDLKWLRQWHTNDINDFIKMGTITNKEILDKIIRMDNDSYLKYQREININNILYQVGDPVNLPLGEKGVIDSINDRMLWGFKYNVKITQGNINDTGDILDFKAEQFH
jgi:hypothetical protein